MSDYTIRSAHAAIDSLAQELETIKKELEDQKNLVGGNLLPITKYPVMVGVFGYVKDYKTPERARREVERLYQESIVLKDANQAAIKNNQAVYDGLVKLISSVGIPSHYLKVVNSRSGKTRREFMPWIDALKDLIKTEDEFPKVQRIYEEKLSEIAKWEKEIEEQKRNEEMVREAEKKHIRNIKTLGRLENKYGLALTESGSEILDAILSKDKYLALGHALRMNRGDWADGPEYARDGLQEFGVEIKTDIDQAIYDEISEMVNDWQGDGRCFRDADYGYDYLFGLVDKELLSDYEEVMELVEY
jgi:DNA repair exonuclease SbcCD ATPase subunit